MVLVWCQQHKSLAQVQNNTGMFLKYFWELCDFVWLIPNPAGYLFMAATWFNMKGASQKNATNEEDPKSVMMWGCTPTCTADDLQVCEAAYNVRIGILNGDASIKETFFCKSVDISSGEGQASFCTCTNSIAYRQCRFLTDLSAVYAWLSPTKNVWHAMKMRTRQGTSQNDEQLSCIH